MKKNGILNLERITNKISISIILSLSIYTFIYLFNSEFFKIKTILVSGNDFINKSKIEKIIGNEIYDKNIYNINIDNLNKEISSHQFIKNLKIYTTLPNTISIIINEINPILLFQNEKDYYLIDQNYSKIKADVKSINYYNVPIIVNNGSFNNYYKEIVESLNYIIYNNIDIYKTITELKLNGDELLFIIQDNSLIKLSVENIRNNTIKLVEFDKQLNQDLNLTSYKHIDLTIPNQIIVKEKTI